MPQGVLDSCTGFLRSWTNPGSRRASWQVNCSCCLVSSFTELRETGLPEWHWHDDFKWLSNIEYRTSSRFNTVDSWLELHVWAHVSVNSCLALCYGAACKSIPGWQVVSFILFEPKWCPLLPPLMWGHDAFSFEWNHAIWGTDIPCARKAALLIPPTVLSTGGSGWKAEC